MSARKISDSTILTTGIISWLLLAFAATKLAVIYATNPALAFVITYNVASFIFLLYFIGYFKERFGASYLMLLILTYNIGLSLLDYIYNKLFYLHEVPFDMARALAAAIINLVFMFITWGVLYLFIRKHK